MNNKFNKFPYEIENLDKDINEDVSKNFSDGLPKLVQVGPQKMLIPHKFREEAEKYYNFQYRPNDVFIMGYPRSGTTLTQEMAWLLINNLDFQKAEKSQSLIARVPLIESRSVTTEKTIAEVSAIPERETRLKLYTSSLEILTKMTERRIIKTHLHFSFLPPDLLNGGCKIIYLARNPKDVVVSLYHLQRNSHGRKFIGNFEKYLDYFMSNLTFFSPYWTHLQQGWERRNASNVRFLFYEDLIQNLRHHISEIAKFLDVQLTSKQLDQLEDTLSFDKFKKYMSGTDKLMNNRNDVNDDFIRKGKIGGWKDYFTGEMNARADKWIGENMARIGIEFPFKI